MFWWKTECSFKLFTQIPSSKILIIFIFTLFCNKKQTDPWSIKWTKKGIRANNAILNMCEQYFIRHSFLSEKVMFTTLKSIHICVLPNTNPCVLLDAHPCITYTQPLYFVQYTITKCVLPKTLPMYDQKCIKREVTQVLLLLKP